MSISHCLKCEFVVRVPIPGGPAMELRCGRVDRMVDVCITVMGCPRGKFPAARDGVVSSPLNGRYGVNLPIAEIDPDYIPTPANATKGRCCS